LSAAGDRARSGGRLAAGSSGCLSLGPEPIGGLYHEAITSANASSKSSGSAGTTFKKSSKRARVASAQVTSTHRSHRVIAWRPFDDDVVTEILRGLAFSATGMARRSTPPS